MLFGARCVVINEADVGGRVGENEIDSNTFTSDNESPDKA